MLSHQFSLASVCQTREIYFFFRFCIFSLKVGAAPPPSSVASAPWELNFAYVDTTAQLLVRALQMETRSNDSLSPHAPAPLLEGGAKVLHLANGKKAGYAKVSRNNLEVLAVCCLLGGWFHCQY